MCRVTSGVGNGVRHRERHSTQSVAVFDAAYQSPLPRQLQRKHRWFSLVSKRDAGSFPTRCPAHHPTCVLDPGMQVLGRGLDVLVTSDDAYELHVGSVLKEPGAERVT